jgi:C1A family cysteine protease
MMNFVENIFGYGISNKSPKQGEQTLSVLEKEQTKENSTTKSTTNLWCETCSLKQFKPLKYGWKRDLPDKRDHKFTLELVSSIDCLNNIRCDLRSNCPEIYNQGELGSCTANAIGCAIQYDEIKQKLESNIPSRLFIYYNERDIEGNIHSDTGASIRDGIKSINNIGYCNENQWPYIIEKFDTKPDEKCYEYASQHKSLSYKRVSQNEKTIKTALNLSFPVVFGISVYESFETEDVSKTGIVPMPDDNEKLLGGHAIVLVGYDCEKRLFTFRNSWGESWGDKGYGYLPFEYVLNPDLADDFWTVTKIC